MDLRSLPLLQGAGEGSAWVLAFATRGANTTTLEGFGEVIPVFYRPEQSSDAAESFSPSAGKPKLVIEDWLSHPEIAQYIQIESFAPAGDDLLLTAHDANYVRGIFTAE